MAQIILKEKFFKWNSPRHPWIFRGSIAEVKAQNGDVVDVKTASGRFLGRGFYSAQSQIAVRLITFADETIDQSYWRKAVQAAVAYRKKVVSNSNAYRLISSEADHLPGVVADLYDDHLVLQTLCPGAENLKEWLVEEISAQLPITCVIERNDVQVRLLEGLPLTAGVLKGNLRADLCVREGDIKFHVDPLQGQKTGAYLDQRENRLAARKYAHGKVLDTFCYQGAFALHLAQNSECVIAIDSSREALEVAEKNAALNQLTNIEFRRAKVFDVLNNLRGKETFELICLDPPAFAKSKKDVKAAERAYLELNSRAMSLLAPGGILVTSSCSYHMSETIFLGLLERALEKQNRMFRILEKRAQASDHPILVNLPESYYLKCFILQMI